MSSTNGSEDLRLGRPARRQLAPLNTRTAAELPLPLSTREYAPTPRVLSDVSRRLSLDLIYARIGQFDPDRITMEQRRQMRRDPMIQMGLHFTKTPLINAPYHFEGPDPKINAFVEQAYRPIHTALILACLNSLEWGYSPIVKRFKLQDVSDWTFETELGDTKKVWAAPSVQAVVWNQPVALPPLGARPLFTPDGSTFAGIKHDRLRQTDDPNNPDASRPLEIPASHSLWITNEQEQNFGDWYGYPQTGYAFRYWGSYWYRWLLGDRHFETDADPPLVVRVPNEYVDDPDNPDGDPISALDLGVVIGEKLRDGSTIVFPSDHYTGEAGQISRLSPPKWDAAFLRGGENMKAFSDSFEYLDVMKLRAMMVPEQALVEGKGATSSRNVASVYGAIFAQAQAIRAQKLDELRNEYMIPDLVAQNFSDPKPCKIVTTGFTNDDEQISEAILTAIANGHPEMLDLDYRTMAQSLGLPVLDPAAARARRQQLQQQQPGADPNATQGPGRGTSGEQPPSSNGSGSATSRGQGTNPPAHDDGRQRLSAAGAS